ncbi:MAG: hypothetical protein KDD21_08525 [Bacteroidetes bacterium]|nr:hypothetical protein [Bacteroidota bacterium]
MLKKISIFRIVNLLYFCAILVIGIVYCKERALFADCSPALYEFIDKHIPYFGLNRISPFINYIFPCLLSLFDVPISVIIYSFGLNYLLLPILVYVFLRYKQTSIKYEVLFLVSFAFFNTYTFFYSLHDYWTGFYLFFVLIRLIDDVYFKTLKRKIIYILLLNILILNAHSSLLFPLFSFYLFYYIFGENKDKQILKYAGSVLVLYALLNVLLPMHYDKVILASDIFDKQIFHSIMFVSFIKSWQGINLFYCIAIIFTVAILLYKKKFTLTGFFIFIVVASFALFLLYFQQFEYTIYSEGQLKAVATLVPIIIVFCLFRFLNKKYVLMFAVVCYSFSVFNLLKGANLVRTQYNAIKHTLTLFDSNVYLTSSKENCPLECISIAQQSYFINQLEFNRNFCIFSNINDNKFVQTLNQHWIEQNKTQTNKLLKFPDEIKYLNADSLGVDITKMFAIYPNNSCDMMIDRLSH